MAIKFLTDQPVAYITDIKALVISDLHIGLETELLRSGIKIHKQIEKFKKIIDELVDLAKAKMLIILGDVKYKVPGMFTQELRDIPKFFEYFSSKMRVIIALGNHDDYLQTLLPPKVKAYGSRGFKMGRYGFFHGHAWPSKKLLECDYVFMGHLQPSVEFRDKLGYRDRQRVWLRTKLSKEVIKKKYDVKKTGKLELIILPAFNSLSGSLNVAGNHKLSGPLLNNAAIILEDAKAYLMDGTYLGDVKSLKKRFQKFLLSPT